MSEQTQDTNGATPPADDPAAEAETPGTGEIFLAVATIVIAGLLVLIALDGLFPGRIFGFTRGEE